MLGQEMKTKVNICSGAAGVLPAAAVGLSLPQP